jgi:hypothetical protein
MATRPQGSFAWTDPTTGIRYWGDDGAARMVAHMQGQGQGVSTPPAPAAVVTPQPFDPALENQRQQAGFNITTGDAEANYQTGQTAYSTGYNADGSLNAGNPYSQAMLLQDNYKRSQTGTNNSMASQGQLYSGARLNAQARNDRLYAEGSAGLRDQTRERYHQIGYGRLQNYGQNSLGTSQAGYDSLRRSVYGG